MYRWHVLPAIDEVGWDLPRFGPAEEFEDLPLLFQANDLRQEDFEGHRTNVKLNVLMEFGKGERNSCCNQELDELMASFALQCNIVICCSVILAGLECRFNNAIDIRFPC